MFSADLSLIESAVKWCCLAAGLTRVGRLQRLFYEMFASVNQIEKFYFLLIKWLYLMAKRQK